MNVRTTERARGAGALALLLVAVVGIPWALTALGQGPPSSLPSGHTVANWAADPLTDQALVRTVAVLCWAVWLLFVAAVAVEIVTQVGQRTTRPGRSAAPGRRRLHVPGLQGIAATCVLTALLLLPQRPPPGDLARWTAPAVARPLVTPHADPAAALRPDPDAETPPGWGRYVVQRYDSPWSIAEQHLGHGARWRELRDEDGRRLWQADLDKGPEPGAWSPGGGTRWTGRARTIYPGDVLWIPGPPAEAAGGPFPHPARPSPAPQPSGPTSPADPAAPTAPAQPAGVPAAPTAPARPAGDPAAPTAPAQPAGPTTPGVPAAPTTPAQPAGPTTPAPPVPPATPAQPAGPTTPAVPAAPSSPAQPAGPTTPARPVPPATPAQPAGPTTPGVPAAPTSPARPGPVGSGALDPPAGQAIAGAAGTEPGLGTHDRQPLDDSTTPPPILAVAGKGPAGRSLSDLPLALVEGGLLSAAAFGMIELLRRRQRQHRPQDRRICLPAGDVVRTEVGLRIGQRQDVAERIERAMSALFVHSAVPPGIVGVIADVDAVELLLAEPAPATAPWLPAAEGFRWRLADDDVDPAAALPSAPLPALVPMGKAAGSGADVLVNLEAAGVLVVKGDPVLAAGMVHAMATSLCGLPWAAALNLILVGFGEELAAAPQVRVVASLGAVMTELSSTAMVTGELLAAHRCRDTWEGRARGIAGDGWPPTIVLCTVPVADAELSGLLSVAVPGHGVAAVVLSDRDGPAGWSIDADRTPMAISPLRLAVEPTVMPAADLGGVGRLLTIAGDTEGAALVDPPYDRIQLSGQRSASTAEETGSCDRPAPPILVRVLGTVEIDGAAEFKRAKSRELAVYLALHPHGVGEAELDEALWPSEAGRLVPPSTRDSTVSVARTALGGPARLLPAQGQGREKRYQLSGEVDSDFAMFCRLHRHGRATGSLDALRQALALVRGRPFEAVISGRTFTWIHTEGHARHIEGEVGDAADLAAQLFLERGQVIEARWAARQGLMADPLCERLWVRLMESADRLGESLEVERLMDELDIVLELGGDFSGLHPTTLAAYDRYRHGSSQRSRSQR